MLLAIDIGNSHISYGVHDGNSWCATFRQHTDPLATEDEIGAFVTSAIERHSPGAQLTRFGVSSVVPTLDERIARFGTGWLGLEPFFVGHSTAPDLKFLVERPEEVGADRIANAVAALRKYGKPAIVVDMGTATTFEAISQAGEYAGGAIMPGIEISMAALFRDAAKLPKVSLSQPEHAIGRNTEENIRSGAFYGAVAAIDGIVTRIAAELGGNPAVIATGGLSNIIAAACSTISHVDSMLTLDGIRFLASTP